MGYILKVIEYQLKSKTGKIQATVMRHYHFSLYVVRLFDRGALKYLPGVRDRQAAIKTAREWFKNKLNEIGDI